MSQSSARFIDEFDFDRYVIDFVSFHPIAVKVASRRFLMTLITNMTNFVGIVDLVLPAIALGSIANT